jgi:transcriptional regulator with XRE-family HTH domain
MALSGSRGVQQRRLRSDLRRFREQSGHTQQSVAESFGWSVSKVIRIETGAVLASPDEIRALMHFYGVRDAVFTDELAAVAGNADAGWWDIYRGFYGKDFLDFLDFENSALRIRQYTGFVVPGLLQTEAYMRTLLGTYNHDEERIERGVAIRQRRQKVLSPANHLEAWFVLDEAALHRLIGGPEVVRDQIEHLRTVAKQPNVSIRVLPFAAGMHLGMRGSFTILESGSADEDIVVNIEDPHRDVLVRDEPETVSKFVETFYSLEELAAPERELEAFLVSLEGNLPLSCDVG